jgi:putative transposase
MPNRLARYYGAGYSHFITTSCWQRRPFLSAPHVRDLFLQTLELVRRRYEFVVVGYVVMPEHVHLLLTEPARGDPSDVMKAIKLGFARRLQARVRLGPHHADGLSLGPALAECGRVWQARFYDFVVFSEKKRVDKLRYMHRNPVKRGLVLEPGQWVWSSYRHYALDEAGPVLVNEPQRAALRVRKVF